MTRLSLLSGGEKALGAIAFLFSLFLARPSPFYLLDEVEAALDDTNIGRFTELLRTYADRAQFIVITHQKRTMEAADVLYGVTMGADGVSQIVSRRLPRDDEARSDRVNDLAFVRRAVSLLASQGIATWMFGGWGEELRGLILPREHVDLDLLYAARGLATRSTRCTCDWIETCAQAASVEARVLDALAGRRGRAVRSCSATSEGWFTQLQRRRHDWPENLLGTNGRPLAARSHRTRRSPSYVARLGDRRRRCLPGATSPRPARSPTPQPANVAPLMARSWGELLGDADARAESARRSAGSSDACASRSGSRAARSPSSSQVAAFDPGGRRLVGAARGGADLRRRRRAGDRRADSAARGAPGPRPS